MNRQTFTRLLPFAAVAALAACDSSQSEEQAAETAPATAPAPAAPTAGSGSASPAATIEGEAIPAALQGVWGLSPAECAAGPAATGLLEVRPTDLVFFESWGTLEQVEEASARSLRATFLFEGEGMQWQREMALSLEDDGRTLIRRDYGEDAAADPFRYTRC